MPDLTAGRSRWEYMDVAIQGHGWTDSRGNTGQLSSSPYNTGTGPYHSPVELLNQLGADGWELAGDLYLAGTYILHLKRPYRGQAGVN